ncbi:dihydrofolate reductase [Trueperella bialowiezensis]|uniref:Dihydrofolate reductase n=1 Tax=Trueperella bialowiezensis TaxID=312285 RepID=A0A3S4YYV3_9ACTO|nr:dihydrofolate reductase [Trueperella bialowiezensis]VEI13817.1 Dihydrofolate reductase [Trueperella bialowiezensis]
MLGLIWAQGHDRAIGRDGAMAWHVPEDMAFFRTMTTGHPVIMGRKTWESLGEKYRPLPGRQNIVVTRNPGYFANGALLAPSVEEAYSLARMSAKAATGEDDPLVWVMGGGQIYAAALELADGVVVTDIDLEVPGADTFAPHIPFDWETVSSDPERGWHTSTNGTRYRMSVYRKKRSGFNPGGQIGH